MTKRTRVWNSLNQPPPPNAEIAVLLRSRDQYLLTRSGEWHEIVRAGTDEEGKIVLPPQSLLTGEPAGWCLASKTFYCGGCGKHKSILLRGHVPKGHRFTCFSCQEQQMLHSMPIYHVRGPNGSLQPRDAEQRRLKKSKRTQLNYRNFKWE